ncbi:MAG: hypothetical protein KC646_05155 [Candidatus Cloacimonetes bacterium]|nr:hypothetical protein [Candidatus Cloacimonadota bacterium]
MSKFGGSHQKGKKSKIISKFDSINDLENYILNLFELFTKIKEANNEHNFQCISYVCLTPKLDQQTLEDIRTASSSGLQASYLYSKVALALSKFEEENSTGKYFRYKQLDTDNGLDETSQETNSYRAIAPKIFGLIVLFVVMGQLASFLVSFMSDKYDDMRYAKLDQALVKGDSFSLYQNALKFDEDQVDEKFGFYIDELVKSTIHSTDTKVKIDYLVIKERILALESKLKSFPAVRLYSNLIGLHEKSLEGEISFHEINQLLIQSATIKQKYIILVFSLDLNVKKFQLIQKAIMLKLKDEDLHYILTHLFQLSLKESIDGRFEYYKTLIKDNEDPDFRSILQNNLIHFDDKIRRNSYKLLVQLKNLESYQFAQFIDYELTHTSDYLLLARLISSHYLDSLKSEVLPSLELIYKKAKRSKASSQTLADIQKGMLPFK